VGRSIVEPLSALRSRRIRGEESSGLDVGARVHFLGSRAHEDVLKAYADAGVVALASAHENFGMVAAEAAAAGKAILLTDRSGVAELLAPDGALITPYDRDGVSKGLESLLADPAARARFGQRAEEVAEEWSWRRAVDLQQSVYHEATHGRTMRK
jgi:glycosyltransferase involved in cell wall biosynthesis